MPSPLILSSVGLFGVLDLVERQGSEQPFFYSSQKITSDVQRLVLFLNACMHLCSDYIAVRIFDC